MDTEMYIGREEKGIGKKLIKAAEIRLWVAMIGITGFFTFQSL